MAYFKGECMTNMYNVRNKRDGKVWSLGRGTIGKRMGQLIERQIVQTMEDTTKKAYKSRERLMDPAE